VKLHGCSHISNNGRSPYSNYAIHPKSRLILDQAASYVRFTREDSPGIFLVNYGDDLSSTCCE